MSDKSMQSMIRLAILLLVLSCGLAQAQNRSLTPGAIRHDLTDEQVCWDDAAHTIPKKWSLDVRHVTEKMKRQVYALYGIPWADRSGYIVDHLVPRELAGADVVYNLWPQPAAEAKRIKDPLENKAHKAVCDGEMKLRAAQLQFAVNWREFHVMRAPLPTEWEESR